MPTRRALLLTALSLPLAGCTSEAPEPAPAPVDPDLALRAAALDRERSLLQAYDDAVAAVPALAPLLAPLRADHEEHVRALSLPTPSGAPTATTPSRPAPGPLPTDPAARRAAVLARLATAERDAAGQHAAAALPASRGLAALLGQLAASEASHPVALA